MTFKALEPFNRCLGVEGDITACGIIHNQALFVSNTVDFLTQESDKTGNILICATREHFFQIGELIETLHGCISALKGASYEVDELERIWSDLTRIKAKREKARLLFQEHGLSREADVHGVIADADGDLASLDEKFGISLEHRVNCSMDYVKEFTAGISNIGVVELPGRQLFEDYIVGMTAKSFEIIRSVYNYYHNYRDEGDELYDKIHRAETARNTDDIRRLQITAEIFMVVILFPYYSEHYLSDFFADIFGMKRDSNVHKFLWITIVVSSIVYGAISLSRHLPRTPFGMFQRWLEKNVKSTRITTKVSMWPWAVLMFIVLWFVLYSLSI